MRIEAQFGISILFTLLITSSFHVFFVRVMLKESVTPLFSCPSERQVSLYAQNTFPIAVVVLFLVTQRINAEGYKRATEVHGQLLGHYILLDRFYLIRLFHKLN